VGGAEHHPLFVGSDLLKSFNDIETDSEGREPNRNLIVKLLVS
jgi:hypothetical protein